MWKQRNASGDSRRNGTGLGVRCDAEVVADMRCSPVGYAPGLCSDRLRNGGGRGGE